MKFYEYIVGNEMIKVLDKKMQIIQDWPRSRNVHEIRQFYDLINYYRQFIKEFDSIAASLSDLFEKHESRLIDSKHIHTHRFRSIVWNIACQLTFEWLKNALTNASILHQSDSTKFYFIEIDTSDFAIDYALMQIEDDELMHSIAYENKKLNDIILY